MGELIKAFTDLIAWQEAHRLTILIYRHTDGFPRKEIYSLTDQMRRSSVSVGSNIAEGFSRRSKKEKTQFYYMAKGSLTELQNQLFVARDVGYLPAGDFEVLTEQCSRVGRLLTGLIRSLH